MRQKDQPVLISCPSRCRWVWSVVSWGLYTLMRDTSLSGNFASQKNAQMAGVSWCGVVSNHGFCASDFGPQTAIPSRSILSEQKGAWGGLGHAFMLEMFTVSRHSSCFVQMPSFTMRNPTRQQNVPIINRAISEQSRQWCTLQKTSLFWAPFAYTAAPLL